ncbi:MAG: 3-deoxy-8-phosphooctulonate synthase [Kiritimatiellia bacterium]
MPKKVTISGIKIGQGQRLALIAGPCVIESRSSCLQLAGKLHALASEEGIPLIFKASFDKANRTSVDAFRGPGIAAGLEILAEVRARFGMPVLTDVHTEDQAQIAGAVVDVLQIPAFLCRQTDLLTAAGETGCVVNIKKGQFLAAEDMAYAANKVAATGNHRILLTERGSTFGYRNLVVDMRNLPIMRALGYPVIFDATHSVQRPGAGQGSTAGDGHMVPYLARAAVAAGCDAVFMETHVNPAKALSDGPNAIAFKHVRRLWRQMKAIHEVVS